MASQEHAVRTRAARNSRGVRTRKQLERHVGKQTLHQRIARILYHDLRHVCMPPCALTGAGKRMALLLQAAAVRAVAGGNASARRCCVRVRADCFARKSQSSQALQLSVYWVVARR